MTSFLSFIQKVFDGENVPLFEKRPAIAGFEDFVNVPSEDSTYSTEKILMELAKSEYPDVREFVAKYRSTQG